MPIATIDPNTLTVRELFNVFLDRQLEKTEGDRIQDRSYLDQRGWLKRFGAHVGPGRLVVDLNTGDFAGFRAKLDGKSPHTINRAIAQVKSPFLFAVKNGLIPRSVVFGDDFEKAPVSEKRKRSKGKKRHFQPAEIRKILKRADAPLKAMILLGLNCGFYATDCANLPRWAVDLNDGWLEYDRAKTGVSRAAPLWPETVKAIREALAVRGKAKLGIDDEMVFLTKYGNRWVHTKRGRDDDGAIVKVSRIDPIGQAFTKLIHKLGIKHQGLGFSALRKTFRTYADEANDRNAALMIMGHSFEGMDEWYVKAIVRKRLEKVVNHVRKVLLDPKKVAR